MNEEALN
jgi:hypothetical protein